MLSCYHLGPRIRIIKDNLQLYKIVLLKKKYTMAMQNTLFFLNLNQVLVRYDIQKPTV